MSNICALMTDKSSCKLNLTARNTLLLKCLVRLVCVCACTFKGGGGTTGRISSQSEVEH